MKHIVFIVGSYYPYYSAVGNCLGNVVEELEKNNKVTVVCFNSKINQSSKERYSNHDIIRVYTDTMNRRSLLERNVVESIGTKKKISEFKLKLHRGGQLISTILSKETINKQLVDKYLNVLYELDNIDIIIPTCNPFDSVMAALEFKKKYSYVKIVPFLFDKFSVSHSLHRLEINRKVKMKNHLSLEEKMIKNSEKIIFVESWKAHLKKNFPNYKEKYCLVEHPLIKKMNLNKNNTFFNEEKINIVYTGVVSKTARSPIYILRLFSEILKTHKNIVLHFYVLGNATDVIDEYEKKFPTQIINHGEVSTDKAHEAMINSSYLLSVGNTDITQVPSKIFEYMSCGKPVIHTYVDKNDPVNVILKKYPIAFCLEQKDDKMEKNIRALELFLEESLKYKVDFMEIQKTFFNALPKYSADIIQKI